MKFDFCKFQGNGNDFVIIDGRKQFLELTSAHIKLVCDRHFGIGADGLMVLQNNQESDFEMLYYNSDGQLSSLCGNGGRCIAAFAFLNRITGKNIIFKAFDGIHKAIINEEIIEGKICDVSLSMNDVVEVVKEPEFYVLNTGSPHYVEFVKNVAEIDIIKEGRKTRYSERFAPAGINVNFVEVSNNRIFVRTYERGVEDETLSCGTGVTAAAIATFIETGKKGFSIHTTGGEFNVDFVQKDDQFKSIWLRGPAEKVFKGSIEL